MTLNNCLIVVDVDGTIIPLLVNFDEIREKIRRLLGINHPLKPLGESLANLPINEEDKRKAWEIIENAELESIEKINPELVRENTLILKQLRENGYKVILVTMRSRKTLLPLLEKLGLTEFSSSSLTRDNYPSRKQQLEHVKKGFQGKIVFIGDTIYDEKVAFELGVDFIRVESYIQLPAAINSAIEICRDL